MSGKLVAPFPYYGGKRRHTAAIWQALGDPQAYVEPFCGSSAVLLNRPPSDRQRRRELINDLNCWVTNFWLAVKAEPEAVAEAMAGPVNEVILAGRQHRFTDDYGAELRSDLDAYDVQLAGWWAWGMSCSISLKYPNGSLNTVPFCKSYQGSTQRHIDPADWCRRLADRLTHVQVVCGEWERSLARSLHMDNSHDVGVFLDPPYDSNQSGLKERYIADDCAANVAQWAVDNGEDGRYRIVLCGFPGEHQFPDGWTWHQLGNVGRKGKAQPEGMWLSPNCFPIDNI